MADAEIWDITFPAGDSNLDFEDIPIPVINCLDDGQIEQLEKAISVIKVISGKSQASAWIALFEQILHLRQAICSQERKLVNEFNTIAESMSKDKIINLPADCIGLQLTFLGNPVNFEIRTPLVVGLPGKFNFGGVCFSNFGGYTNEIPLERVSNFIPCLKGSNKALIYLYPRVSMKVVAVVEK